MATEKVPKSSKVFECIKCNFTTVRKSQYDRHLLTRKHNNQQKSIKKFQCDFCGKSYVDKSGLWRHNKKCKPPTPIPETSLTVLDQDNDEETSNNIEDLALTTENMNDPAFILKLVEQNRELQNLLKAQQQKMHDQFDKHHEEVMKLIPQVGNNNNNRFNLNIFLNEKCKDAINWNEFIQSIEVGMSDMENVVDSNITKGVVKVICNGIDKLGVYKRPIHCLDMKRKKLCLKNKDVWEKDSGVIKETLEMGNRKIQQKHMMFIK